jgi:hypothetical protein
MRLQPWHPFSPEPKAKHMPGRFPMPPAGTFAPWIEAVMRSILADSQSEAIRRPNLDSNSKDKIVGQH